MRHYLLSVHVGPGAPADAQSADQRSESARAIGALERELRSAGALKFSGRLREPESASVVRSVKGKVMTTDGPFVEAKEHLGGFYIIAVDGDEAAMEWASKTSRAVGMPIEVWPFMDVSTG